MKTKDGIEEFLTYVQVERRLSANTVSAYGRDLALLQQDLARVQCHDIDNITKLHLRRFSSQQYREGLKATTIGRRIFALRAFFKFLVRRGYRTTDPMSSLKTPKIPKRSPKFLSP